MPWVDFDNRELSIMHALFDTLIPPDDYPGGWDGGASLYLEKSFQSDLRGFIPQYKVLIGQLGERFIGLSLDERSLILGGLDPVLVDMAAIPAAEGYYASPGPGWEMVGYEVTA